MRTNRFLPVALLAVMIAGVTVGAPLAGAAGHRGHTWHAPRVSHQSARPGITSPVAPLSNGYVEVTDDSGATSLTPGTVPRPEFFVGSSLSELGVQLIAPSIPGQPPGPLGVSISSGSIGVPVKAGQVYGAGGIGKVEVIDRNNCGTSPGDTASAMIDQLTVIGGDEVTSAAVQFYCTTSAGPYQAIYGAFPYNVVPTTPHEGYYTYEGDGAITSFGNDSYLTYLGDLSVSALNKPIVGMSQTADGGGYWMVASDGGIFSYGDAKFYGSAGNLVLNKPIVGMAATRDGKGYWLVASDGGIFAYGDARFYGSTGNIHLNKPVVGMTSTLDGKGYWFVATDGGIFAYGDARFHGSTGNITLAQPIVGMAINADGSGYWMAAKDGGIFAFNTPFYGGLPGIGASVSDVAGLSTLPGLSF